MSFALYNLVVKLFLVTTLLVPGTHNLLQGQEIHEVQQAHEQSLQHRGQLLSQLNVLEDEYHALLEQIDRLKGGANTLQNRMELEDLLRDSRELAKRMQSLQREIRATDARVVNLRSQLVAAIDARLRDVESQLSEIPSSERQKLVAKLNELRDERRQFTEPLPSGPSDGDVSETLATAAKLDGASASDMLAAADELQDTEDQVRKRLSAIEERIGQLRRAKILARRARTFAAEERFFDETDRSRFIAGFSGSASGGQGTNADNSAEPSTGSPVSGNNGNNGSPGAEMPSDGVDGARGEAESPAPDYADDDLGAGAGDDSLSDEPQSPSTAPEPPQDSPEQGDDAAGDDIFSGGDDLLIDNQSDPQRALGPGFESDDELDSRIQQLESEQERLQRQAEELEEKAEQLRNRARDSID